MKIYKLSIVLLLAMISTFSFAQNVIKGKVVDAYTNSALSDISIKAELNSSKNTSSTQTDKNGLFTLDITDNYARLTFAYPGYREEVVFAKSGNDVLVRLIPNDVANILEGTKYQDKIATTAFSFEDVLVGKVAGAEITKRSGIASEGSLINIRGTRSLFSKNAPLIIVDGLPMDIAPYSSVVDGYNENPLKDIDVKDIDKITILKDGSTIYGSRASGGAILIETKKAEGVKTYIEFTGFGGIELGPKEIPMMGSDYYNRYLLENLNTQGVTANVINQKYPWLNNSDDPNFLNNTNWQEEAYKQQAALQNYYLNVRGGDETAKYSISLGFMDKRNPMGEVGSMRYNTHINGDLQIVKQLKMNVSVGYSVSESDLLPFGVNSDLNPVIATLRKAPIFSPYQKIKNDDGSILSMNVLSDTDVFGMTNPVALINNSSIENEANHLFGSLGLVYDITKTIKLSASAGLDYNKVRQDLFIPSLGVAKIDGVEYDRKSQRNIQNYSSFYSNINLGYNESFSLLHTLKVDAGVNYNRTGFVINKGTDYSMPNDEFKGLSSGSSSASSSAIDMKRVFYNNYQWKTASAYFVASYDYANIVGAEFNLSANGSSNYIPGTASYNPSLTAYWNISEHSFLNSSKWVDLLKLRVSASSLSNDAISSISSQLMYNSIPYNESTGLVIGNLGNNNLKNEVTKQVNAGVDFAVLGQRIVLSADYYISETDNVLLWNSNDVYTKAGGYWYNGAVFSNKGVEASISANILRGVVDWNISGNIAANKSTVKSMTNTKELITSIYGGSVITKEGNNPVEFYGLDKDGNYTSLGSSTPKFFGGFSTSLAYKGVELDLNFSYKYGNEAFNYTRMLVEGGQSYGNQTIATIGTSFDTNDKSLTSLSYRWVEDASYLRLAKVRLAYNLPINNKIIKGLKIFADADNLITWTNYLGYNPDFSYSSSPFTAGVDYGKMPYGQSVVFGVKLSL